MPPKVKTTKEMIVSAAFEITRASGIEAVNAKSVANYLKCSTQPVMYNFATIEELKLTVFDKAFAVMKKQVAFPKGKKSQFPMREVGLDYISFARNEPNLFKLLFQSAYAERCPVDELGVDIDFQPVIEAFAEFLNTSVEEARAEWLIRYFMVHGIACRIVNQNIDYSDEQLLKFMIRFDAGREQI